MAGFSDFLRTWVAIIIGVTFVANIIFYMGLYGYTESTESDDYDLEYEPSDMNKSVVFRLKWANISSGGLSLKTKRGPRKGSGYNMSSGTDQKLASRALEKFAVVHGNQGDKYIHRDPAVA